MLVGMKEVARSSRTAASRTSTATASSARASRRCAGTFASSRATAHARRRHQRPERARRAARVPGSGPQRLLRGHGPERLAGRAGGATRAGHAAHRLGRVLPGEVRRRDRRRSRSTSCTGVRCRPPSSSSISSSRRKTSTTSTQTTSCCRSSRRESSSESADPSRRIGRRRRRRTSCACARSSIADSDTSTRPRGSTATSVDRGGRGSPRRRPPRCAACEMPPGWLLTEERNAMAPTIITKYFAGIWKRKYR